jgi:hypothetical protein
VSTSSPAFREDSPPASEPGQAAPSLIPSDLRLWVRHSTLLRSAQGIAQETGLAEVKPVFSAAARRFQHPWRMLTLLTFSAAIGVSSNREIFSELNKALLVCRLQFI